MIHSSFKTPHFHMTQHVFSVPLNYAKPHDEKLEVFARELVALDKQTQDLPYLVYLQGGPGSESPRPVSSSGWVRRALKDYRVLLLDQRGTGLSSPITFQTLEPFSSVDQAEYLVHFRADNIVRDAEFIRNELLDSAAWSLLGQSFGGFCALRYLSDAPEHLKEVFITGGIASLTRPADDVYEATYKVLEQKNKAFFARYPKAQNLCQDIANHLLEYDISLPNGQRFTVEQFQQFGMLLGNGIGYEQLYYTLEHAFVSAKGKQTLSYTFLHDAFSTLGFLRQPLFSVLHEAIYAQETATNWSAQRIKPDAFNYASGQDFLFTSEMIYPWMFEQYQTLKPLKEVAEILAQKEDWPKLYDFEVLNQNTVPTAAAIYTNDLYVPLEYSLETVQQIPNLSTWVTSEYEHNGLRADGERILDKLITLVKTAC